MLQLVSGVGWSQDCPNAEAADRARVLLGTAPSNIAEARSHGSPLEGPGGRP